MVLGLAQDCARSIAGVVSLLRDLQRTNFTVEAFIGENGSTDRTRPLLEAARRAGAPLEIVDTGFMAGERSRLRRMAQGREHLKIHAARALATAEYVAVIDLDNVMASPPDAGAILGALDKLDAESGIFAVSATSRPYYDLFALRMRDLDLDDLQGKMEAAKRSPLSFYLFLRSEVFPLQRRLTGATFDECTSAFNGLCFYRARQYAAASYLGSDNHRICEHVFLNRQIHSATGGYIHVDDALSVAAPIEHVARDPVSFVAVRVRKALRGLWKRHSAES